MQMCAWRKLLELRQSINSRNLVELHMTLTLASAGCRVYFKALPSSVVFLYGTWCFLQLQFPALRMHPQRST